MELDLKGLRDPFWEQNGISVPAYTLPRTPDGIEWIHFGAGNLYRAYVSRIAHTLLQKGTISRGILAVSYNPEAVNEIYAPHDCLCLYAALRADGKRDVTVNGGTECAVWTDEKGLDTLTRAFESPCLKLVSFTITEKGYSVTSPDYLRDIASSPEEAKGGMGILARLLLARFRAGRLPLTLASLDNCSDNGDKLRAAAAGLARAWEDRALADKGFADYVLDGNLLSFPISMIDKITPAPNPVVKQQLEDMGLTGMDSVRTGRGTMLAPYANAEECEYLFLEDRFTNGRLPLDMAGVYLADRDTVKRAERMKVTVCLNPLHTCLAVFGCLMGYTKICDEMNDSLLVRLVKRLGYTEGMAVCPEPGVMKARDFLNDVVEKRLPNPFLPDTPQRIATDTSQKVGVRYCETVKEYLRRGLDTSSLVALPLAIAGWLRYLAGVTDELAPFTPSPDPLLTELTSALSGSAIGSPDIAAARAILSRTDIFGADLTQAGLADRILGYYSDMLQGRGAVRDTIEKALDNA